jgi:hypothetical protein
MSTGPVPEFAAVKSRFSDLFARITQKDHRYVVQIRLHNAATPHAVWGEEITDSIASGSETVADLQIPAKLRAGIREVPPDQSGNSGFFKDDALRAPNPIARDNARSDQLGRSRVRHRYRADAARLNHLRRDLARSIGVCPACPPTP